MGLEDYRVLLRLKPKKPVFPEGKGTSAGSLASSPRVTARKMSESLESMGFVRQSPVRQAGPAKLATPPSSEIRMTARQNLKVGGLDSGTDGEYIVEALIRGREDSKSDTVLFDSLSMRFALCQPEGAAWHFLRLVKRMCDTLSLTVVHGDKTYSPEAFWAFRLRANEQIRTQQRVWQELFENDGERLPISVDDSWGHFLKKHSNLLANAEATLPRVSVRRPAEQVNLDETLKPEVLRQLRARRTSTE